MLKKLLQQSQVSEFSDSVKCSIQEISKYNQLHADSLTRLETSYEKDDGLTCTTFDNSVEIFGDQTTPDTTVSSDEEE